MKTKSALTPKFNARILEEFLIIGARIPLKWAEVFKKWAKIIFIVLVIKLLPGWWVAIQTALSIISK